VPILKIIEYDVGEILAAYSREQRMTVGELRQPQYQFRELPPFIPFVLENAHLLLPDTAIIDVPQLLSLRELVANDIQTVLARRDPEEILSNEEVRVITRWLGMMRHLVDEIYELLKAIHDPPITQLLEQELH
jgi:hypothetical protein